MFWFLCNNTLSDKLSYDTALMTPLIMHHCSKVILAIHERQSGSYSPMMPLQSICYYLIIQSIAILIGKSFEM